MGPLLLCLFAPLAPYRQRGQKLDAAGTTKYTYTAGNQVLTEIQPFSSSTLTNTYVNRLRVSMVLQQPTGLWTNSFGYDLAARLTNVTSPAGVFSYLPGASSPGSSLLKKIALPNTSYITNQFDNVARLAGTYLDNSANSILDSAVYGYNTANQRTAFTNAAGTYVIYAYDNIGQLKVAASSVASEKRGYVYDSAWNMTWLTNNASLIGYDLDNKNELTNANGFVMAYDSNGNRVTNNNDLVYTYDGENRLTQISDTVFRNFQTAFTYDGFGRLRKRLEQTWNGSKWITAGTTEYIYDGTRVTQERDGSNNPLVSYTRGTDLSGSLEDAGGIGGLLARSSGYSGGNWSAHHFYHADGGGNIMYLEDSNQAMAATYRYDPYGNLLSSSGTMAATNVYRFSSREFHANSGMYIYLYRFYDPSVQRWLNRDPMGETWDFNLYRFVYDDPLDWIDSDGLAPMKGGEVLVRMHNGYGGLNPLFGKIWNVPNTAIGLVWGGLGIPFGAKPSFGNNALQFENHPFMFGGDITFGNVICYRKGMGPRRQDPDNPPYTFGDHERQHTKQGEQLGPLYLPAYGMFGLGTLFHGGDFFGPDNPMERGPYASPPRPWLR